MSAHRALLLDALGTLVRLEPPAPALQTEIAARFELELALPDVERAIAAEIAHYRAHHLEGRDAGSLAQLRRACAEVLRAALPPAAAQLDLDELVRALMASLRFAAYPEVPEALARERAAGRRLVVASNWDVGLHDVLAALGLSEHLDAIVTSAEVGAAKPDPRVLERALELAGATPAEALHVGDSPEADVGAARAAGIAVVLVARDRPLIAPHGVAVIGSLAELARGAA